ncbi:hypothetical protein SDC9_118737 [bioreactor metagenome]|uniref:Uncharacterized protein n=1 Tax=bioreactor metagenome TaxID=1076179 RepID=A0A645C1R9_9ZZZZ
MRQAEVEDQHPVIVGLDRADDILAVADPVHGKIVLAQAGQNGRSDQRVIFGEQDSQGQSLIGKPPRRSPRRRWRREASVGVVKGKWSAI